MSAKTIKFVLVTIVLTLLASMLNACIIKGSCNDPDLINTNRQKWVDCGPQTQPASSQPSLIDKANQILDKQVEQVEGGRKLMSPQNLWEDCAATARFMGKDVVESCGQKPQ